MVCRYVTSLVNSNPLQHVVRSLTHDEGDDNDEDSVDHSPVGSDHNASGSTASDSAQSTEQDRVCGENDRGWNHESEEKLERRPDGDQLWRPGQLAGRGPADTGVGEVGRGDHGTGDPDDADCDLTDSDRPQRAEAVVAGETAVDAEQCQGEDACEFADVANDVGQLARHLTDNAAKRPTVAERYTTTTTESDHVQQVEN